MPSRSPSARPETASDGAPIAASAETGRGEVALHDVVKRFGSTVAVERLTLTIDDRELFVLLGPSGCGKSTVLRMIAGLEEPTDGTITIGGRRVDGIDAKDRDLAMVFQSYALYPHMTVRRNIEFPLRSRRTAPAERAGLVAEAGAMLGLDGLLDRKPSELSGGQRQRVALARAIVRRPVAFLMDEPLSNLDAKLRVETRAQLVALHDRLATTIVYVTHDQVEAMTMGQRIAVLDAGILHQVGPPQEVYERPADLFVARFIGSPPMNTAAASIESGERGREVRTRGAAPMPLSPPLAQAAARSGSSEVVVGVRPEDLLLDDDGPIPATVAVVESLGHERHVACRLPEGDLWIVLVPAHGACPAVGEPVHLAVRDRRLHLFDASSGARLDD